MTEEKNINSGMPGPLDYAQLLEYGLAYIRQAGTLHWTDFNAHDPGVTILEALTLALNDLSYRSSAAMADLLTRPGGVAPSLEGAMFPAEVILPNAPTTVDDYRKLILENIPGVRNVWLNMVHQTLRIPYIPNKVTSGSTILDGYYDVLVELEDIDSLRNDAEILSVVARDIDGNLIAEEINEKNAERLYTHCIRTFLTKHRNLCENFRNITFLKPVEVGLCAEIEIDSDIDVRSILQDIFDRMYDYVCPTILFHTVEDLLSSGREAEGIFSGEKPSLGFIDSDELRSFTRRTDLYTSDAIGILMGVPGVKAVRHIHFITDENAGGVISEYNGRHISIDAEGDKVFRMSHDFHRNFRISRTRFVNNIVFQRMGLTFYPPAGEGAEGLSVHPKQEERKPLPAGFLTSVPLPKGTFRGTDRYFSFQNLFPSAYRMGIDTLPQTASPLRKAERMQLKAYLSFFDQVLADYLAQLDHLQDILALGEGDNNTYFHHYLMDTDVVDISEVLEGYTVADGHADYRIPSDTSQTDLQRKNSILNHLLSRFADSFAEYTALEFVRKGYEDEFSLLECVEDKKRFLKDYPRISSLRSSGIDWTDVPMNVSGAERRILRKLGVNDPDSQGRIADHSEMGLHLLEHSLFVPRSSEDPFLQLESGTDRKRLLDNPYSFRVTAVLPGWIDLAGNLHYRQYVENIIREELPAHVFVKICWLSREVMGNLEDAYSEWQITMADGARFQKPSKWEKRHTEALKKVIDAFGQFSNIYQTAVVMPDDTMDYVDDESATRLDFTFLGSEDYPDASGNGEGQGQTGDQTSPVVTPPSSDQGEGILPGGQPEQGGETPPENHEEEPLPSGQGGETLPENQGGEVTPSDQGEGILPGGQPEQGGETPPENHEEEPLPSGQGGETLPENQGGEVTPSDQGEGILPGGQPEQGGETPPENHEEEPLPSGQDDGTLIEDPGKVIPPAVKEEVSQIIDTLLESRSQVITALYQCGPQTLGSLIEAIRIGKETQN